MTILKEHRQFQSEGRLRFPVLRFLLSGFVRGAPVFDLPVSAVCLKSYEGLSNNKFKAIYTSKAPNYILQSPAEQRQSHHSGFLLKINAVFVITSSHLHIAVTDDND